MTVEHTTHIILRSEVQANPRTLYLFGDNTRRVGLGGQAKEMRYEPNTAGICTKLRPCNAPDCFMTDEDLGNNKEIIALDVEKVLNRCLNIEYDKVVIPPIGVGLAKLQDKAPLTWAYLQSQLAWLESKLKEV